MLFGTNLFKNYFYGKKVIFQINRQKKLVNLLGRFLSTLTPLNSLSSTNSFLTCNEIMSSKNFKTYSNASTQTSLTHLCTNKIDFKTIREKKQNSELKNILIEPFYLHTTIPRSKSYKSSTPEVTLQNSTLKENKDTFDLIGLQMYQNNESPKSSIDQTSSFEDQNNKLNNTNNNFGCKQSLKECPAFTEKPNVNHLLIAELKLALNKKFNISENEKV